MEFIDAVRKFISIDTTPENGTREAALWIKENLKIKNFQITLQEDTHHGLEQANVLIEPTLFSKTENQTFGITETFILQSHIDTANPASAMLWKDTHLNPFNLIIKNDHFYGLGVADSKLDFLCKLEALKFFANVSEWKRRPLLVGTFGQEIGMHGMLRFIRKNKVNAKMAIIGDPTDLQLGIAGKGHAILEIKIPFSSDEIEYRKQHDLSESASTQTKVFNTKREAPRQQNMSPSMNGNGLLVDESVIEQMFKYILQLPDSVALMEIDAGVSFNTLPMNGVIELDLVGGLRDTMVQKLKKIYAQIIEIRGQLLTTQDHDFNPSSPQLDIGTIKTVDDQVTLTLFFRFPPKVSEQDSQVWFKKLEDSSRQIQAQTRVLDYKRPFRSDQNSELVSGCQSILSQMELSPQCVTQAHTSEASLLSRVGLTCLCFGAGFRNNNVHTPHENVKIEKVERAIEFYKNVIQKFCLSSKTSEA